MPTVRLVPVQQPGRPQIEGLVQDGPTVNVRIGFDVSHTPDSPLPPALPEETFLALIDTGSDENFIDTDLARVLALPQLREVTIAGVHGLERGLVFQAHVHIPSLVHTVRGSVFGARMAEAGLPYAAILGRAFLQHVVMHYDGRVGEVTVSND